MASGQGWIGVDLDGTVAVYDGWKGAYHIGEPIPKMVERIKRWLAEGKRVKIFTARVCDGDPQTIKAIEDWCEQHIGQRLEVTNMKDYGMIRFYDDRAVQVIPNTGIVVGGKYAEEG
jgi:hypothetical protein